MDRFANIVVSGDLAEADAVSGDADDDNQRSGYPEGRHSITMKQTRRHKASASALFFRFLVAHRTIIEFSPILETSVHCLLLFCFVTAPKNYNGSFPMSFFSTLQSHKQINFFTYVYTTENR